MDYSNLFHFSGHSQNSHFFLSSNPPQNDFFQQTLVCSFLFQKLGGSCFKNHWECNTVSRLYPKFWCLLFLKTYSLSEIYDFEANLHIQTCKIDCYMKVLQTKSFMSLLKAYYARYIYDIFWMARVKINDLARKRSLRHIILFQFWYNST